MPIELVYTYLISCVLSCLMMLYFIWVEGKMLWKHVPLFFFFALCPVINTAIIVIGVCGHIYATYFEGVDWEKKYLWKRKEADPIEL